VKRQLGSISRRRMIGGLGAGAVIAALPGLARSNPAIGRADLVIEAIIEVMDITKFGEPRFDA